MGLDGNEKILEWQSSVEQEEQEGTGSHTQRSFKLQSYFYLEDLFLFYDYDSNNELWTPILL